jgi:Ser/Thr protein kinase RdoA (MazF antagonist)
VEDRARWGDLERRLEELYGLRGVRCRPLGTPVNDVVEVTAGEDRFALKAYHRARTAEQVQWEVDLVTHLGRAGAPVAQPVAARGAHVHALPVGGRDRVAVLSVWAPGAKPEPTRDTYVLLGQAAARVHGAADGFSSSLPREVYDARALVGEQLGLMRPALTAAGQWERVAGLGERLEQALADPRLDRGICHMDLTLDNVHRAGDQMTVFDLDSAGTCWRSIEPYGVLRSSEPFFAAWLDGYRSRRAFSARDERAVHAFTVIGDLRVVAWKLGVARSSRGEPLLRAPDLVDVVDGWLALEDG